MVFYIILLVLGLALAALPFVLGLFPDNEVLGVASLSLGLTLALSMAIMLPIDMVDAKTNKALMQARVENPTNYTYTQLAEHNEFVTKLGVWHGTIFSFYNNVDLQTIDIDSVSQKILVKQEEEKQNGKH